jgi:hypothetical protein
MACSLALLTVSAALMAASPDKSGVVSGELEQWHRVTVTFAGPETSETAEPNPFRDYRLGVEFAHGDARHLVPGFFAADGHAAESGAAKGNCWRVHFTPEETGTWTYRASFRSGRDVAISTDPAAGRPTAFDGATGSFTVGPSDPQAGFRQAGTPQGRDHRAKGTLRYVGEHYLRFAGSGEFFLKGGADSPENFLAYADFDGTTAAGQAGGKPRQGEAASTRLHTYQPHACDWRGGDPTWRGDKGKGIIGALNYLASKGMNSVYFLTMNVGGDGKDVWPWIGPHVPDRFDCSKLDQWEIVFSHMDRLGIMLHVVTQETENDQLLDGGELGTERRLYYRELIARFAHHLAVVWNLGEENTNTDRQRKDFCRFIHQLDPYGHPIVVHTFPGQYDRVYTPLLKDPDFHGASLQMGDMSRTHSETMKWVTQSTQSGRKWIVCLDEIGPPDTGVKPDRADPDHDVVRQQALWGNLMAGGAGCEWYFGYNYANNDLNCEDWRSRERMWDQTRYALEFFQRYLPFSQMRPADELTSRKDDYCFAKPGKVYAIYFCEGGSTDLELPPGRYTVKWYNPRRGGPLQDGTVRLLSGPGSRPIGEPPSEKSKDWAALVQAVGGSQRH